MHHKDPETGQIKSTYATYRGYEAQVTEGERQRFHTARLFYLKNTKDEDCVFRVRGNGIYEMQKVGLNRVLASGTMMDSTPPEIIPQMGQ